MQVDSVPITPSIHLPIDESVRTLFGRQFEDARCNSVLRTFVVEFAQKRYGSVLRCQFYISRPLETGVSLSSLWRWANQIRDSGAVQPDGRGRSERHSPKDDKELLASVRHLFSTAAVPADGPPRTIEEMRPRILELLRRHGHPDHKGSKSGCYDIIRSARITLRQFVVDSYADKHDAPEVVQYRAEFVAKILELYADPDTLLIMQDEVCFAAADTRRSYWASPDDATKRCPKTVNDGEKHMASVLMIASPRKHAQLLLDPSCILRFNPGKNKDGYFTADLCKAQLDRVVGYLRDKFPGKKLVFVLDHSTCHTKIDGLCASKMNVGSGGAQPDQGSTVYTNSSGARISQVIGTRGLADVLTERGVAVADKTKPQLVEIANSFDDFAKTLPALEEFLNSVGARILWLPKCHPELNAIEYVFCDLKGYVRSRRAVGDIKLKTLGPLVGEALKSITEEQLHKCIDQARRFAAAYAVGMVNLRDLGCFVRSSERGLKAFLKAKDDPTFRRLITARASDPDFFEKLLEVHPKLGKLIQSQSKLRRSHRRVGAVKL